MRRGKEREILYRIWTDICKSTKELYEPLWEEIYARSKANGFRIRSIWMADVAHQGQSSVINEDRLGNDRMLFLSEIIAAILTIPQLAGSIIPEIFSISST